MELTWILALAALAAIVSMLPINTRVIAIFSTLSSLAILSLSGHVALEVAWAHDTISAYGWLSCDALSALFLVLISFVSFCVVLFSWGYMPEAYESTSFKKQRLFYAGLNLFLFSMLVVPILSQLAMAWIAIALSTLFSAFLVSFRSTPKALEAAWKYVVLTSLGALMALFGVFLLYWAASKAGVADFTFQSLSDNAYRLPPAMTITAFLFILVGLGTKIGLVPVHTWLPDTYEQAPVGLCALLSGAEASAVLYFMFRLFPVALSIKADMGSLLMLFGLLSAAVAALLLLQAKDIKRMFAFSTIEHMGIIMVAAGLGTLDGNLGALYQTVSHALAKSFCFMALGMLILSTGSRKIDEIRGLMRSSPLAGASLLAGGLAISGIPPFAVFFGELSIFKAGLSAGHYLSMSLLAIFIVIAFCALMMKVNRMVFGQDPQSSKISFPMSTATALVLEFVPVLLIGLYMPAPIESLLQAAAGLMGGQ